MYLQSLQLQFSPFQHLLWVLKIGNALACLIIFDKVHQSLFPRKDIVSVPNDVVCTFGSCASLPCLKADFHKANCAANSPRNLTKHAQFE